MASCSSSGLNRSSGTAVEHLSLLHFNNFLANMLVFML
jgi:hypothetical protein